LKRKKFVIWGCSGHAKVICEMVEKINGRVVAFFDTDPSVKSFLKKIPIFYGTDGFHKWIKSQKHRNNIFGIVAIGSNINSCRKFYIELFRSNGISTPSIIHPRSEISDSCDFGYGNQFLALSNISSNVKIGNYCIINHKSSIDQNCIIKDGCHIAPGVIICGNVIIEDNVFIGAGSVLLPNITIKKNSIIGAGSVVTRSVRSNSVVAGKPARMIKVINLKK
jgi:sugar O-acyltransferase (sialic acid O-acetyltransferase NeuD family)